MAFAVKNILNLAFVQLIKIDLESIFQSCYNTIFINLITKVYYECN